MTTKAYQAGFNGARIAGFDECAMIEWADSYSYENYPESRREGAYKWYVLGWKDATAQYIASLPE